MSQTIHFNTGRKYGPNGQQITATLHDDGVVTFFDHSRSIHGQFRSTGHFDRDTVLRAYDSSEYGGSTRAWEDGMMRGGCNSKYAGR